MGAWKENVLKTTVSTIYPQEILFYCVFTYYSTWSLFYSHYYSKESINESDMPFKNSSREYLRPFSLIRTSVDELMTTNQRKSF